MKKLIFGLIAVVFLGNLSFGQKRLTSSDLEFVGIQHNFYLEKVIEKINTDNLKSEDKSKLQNFLIDLASNKSSSDKETSEISNEITKQFNQKRTKEDPHLDVVFPSIGIKINKHLKTLDLLIDEYSNDAVLLKTHILNLENDINKDKELDNKDLLVLYTATNVAKYSSKYWNENGKDWILNGNANSTIMQRGGPGGRVIKMDVAGGVGAAVTTFVVNAVPGPGQIAYGTAIVSGAAGASAAQACYEILDWLF